MNYSDFDLIFERVSAGYKVRVVSPAGPSSLVFKLPFSTLELENFLLKIGRPRRSTRRKDSPELHAAKEFGGRLFDAVFDEEVRACLRSSLDKAKQPDQGLRLRLYLDATPELAEIPWEYLYHSKLNRFFSLSTKTPIIRYLEIPERIQPQPVVLPVKILVMISSPYDFPRLEVETEWGKLEEALGDLEKRGLVALTRLERASLPVLQKQLRVDDYHIFHFIGHGSFDKQAQDGALLLEDEHGRGHQVSGQYLGALLHDESTLRLAMLNACEGARASLADPFSGTAQSLVQQGVPAVIAMQFEVTDKTAITLAHEFYTALAEGLPVDAALGEARKAIFAQGNDIEWGTPVLYMRAPDGRIFDINKVAEVVPREESAPPATQIHRTTFTPRPRWRRWKRDLTIALSAITVLLLGMWLWPRIFKQASPKKLPETVFVSIATIPELGATVLLNGNAIGVSPILGRRLQPGTFLIRVEKQNFLPFETQVEIKIGRDTSFTFSLQPVVQEQKPVSESVEAKEPLPSAPPAVKLGRLRVASIPLEAEIFLNGEVRGRTAHTIKDLPLQQYFVVLKKNGYADFDTTITLDGTETQVLTATLAPLPATLKIQAIPFGSIYIDEDLLQEDSEVNYTATLPARRHRLKVTHPKFGFWEKNLDLKPGLTDSFVIDFTKKVKVIIASEPWGEIWVDGKATDDQTPMEIELRVGQHTIEVRRAGYIQEGKPRVIQVEEGKALPPIRFTLQKRSE